MSILTVDSVTKYFPIERGIFRKETGVVRALEGVSFSVREFETLGIVGESGSGKTTLAKIILKLIRPTGGEVVFDTKKIVHFRKDVQIIFQNPYNSLDPRMRVADIVGEPLLIHGLAQKKHIRARVAQLLQDVEMDETSLDRYPSAFSGGQRQRICIARVLACEPRLIVLDEPISSLDLTIQSKLLELFLTLKEKFKFTYIFISHNLAVIKHISDSLIVMRGGRIEERGKTDDILDNPGSPYTRLLLEAARAQVLQ